MTRYLTVEDALRQVERLRLVVRDLGLFASAVERPRQSVFGEDAYKSLWLKAAAMCQSLDHNQSLVDGNKRIAWSLTKTFLAINGQWIMAAECDSEHFMLNQVARQATLEEIADWFAEHCAAMDLPGEEEDFAD